MSLANNLIGKTLSNRYEILRPLGEGGMGKVYLAKDKRFGKQVVVKVPTMEAGDKDFKDRFMREIASLATLEHAHIVTTVDWGEIEGIPFLVLRYLSGGSLRDRITDSQGFYKPMPLEGLNLWLPQIASALDFIHTKNWVHRDLKPDNILFDEAGNPYLADFGIAKALEGAPMGVKTTMGAFIGTPQYMAPEMHLGKSIGPRADQFGLAVLVYEALAGKIPFAGATPTAIFVEVMQGKAKPIHELVPGIPLEKSNALMKGITKEPRDRYGSCVEFANAITGSMLARGLSSAGSETPSRVVIPGTRMETPKKPDILGTRIETPSKPEILGIKNETPTKPIIAGTRLETPSKPEIAETRLETPKKPDIPGTRIETPSNPTIASTRMEIPSKPEIVGIKKDTHLKPEIAGTMPEKSGSKPVIAGTRLERSSVKSPVVKEEESKEELPAERKREKKRKKKGNNFAVLIGTIITGAAALFGIIFVSISMMRPKVSSTLKSTADTINVKDSNVPEINITAEIASIEKEMVLVPAGKFKMGSYQGVDEKQHEVTLTKPFYMGKYEVAQEQWESVMGYNPSSTKGAKLPVTNASWEDCQEFITKLNAKTEGAYRLPTEAEWEYACRAGTTTAYSFGDKITPKDANYEGSKISKPVPVGSYKPNAFGLYDLHGNVLEWCEDWKADYPIGAVTDPKGPADGTIRVLRGGAFYVSGSEGRSSIRHSNGPTSRVNYYGFRLARTADIKAIASPTVPKQDPAVVITATVNLLVAPFTEVKAKEVQKEVAKSLQKDVEDKEDLGQGIKLDLVLIPAGKFKMGSPASEKGRSTDETQHEVTITNPNYMGKYEVTQEQYEVVMGNNPSSNKGAKLPVTNVSWNDCQEFIKKLNARTNGGYRLPTEAEWEYACRAGTSTAYSFGNSLTESNGNIDGSSTKAIGSYKPNAFGLYDMHGNVWEWCEDWKVAYPGGAETDPKGPATGTYRVLRGGSFHGYESLARSSDRLNYVAAPAYRYDTGGFRLAKTPDIKYADTAPTVPKPGPAEIVPATGNLLVTPITKAKAKELQKEAAKSLKKEVEEKADLGKGVSLEMVLVPVGKFMMGSSASEKGLNANETQHEVTLTKPYYMGKYEVTQEQWDAVMGNNPSSSTKGSKLPITDVSWEDCQEFVKKLNAKTSGGYRLPTEAEWEYACRAGTTTAYSFGDSLTKADANYGDGSAGSIKAVGGYKVNAFGLNDMHGNVWEWCEDWYGDYPAGAVTDPKGPATGEERILRGGSFLLTVSLPHSSLRYGDPPTVRDGDNGFRLAKNVDFKTALGLKEPKPDPAAVMPATDNLLVWPFSETEAKETQKAVARSLQKEVEEKEDLGKGINLDLVLIPAGKFRMGSPASEEFRMNNETQHEVTLTNAYYMGKYEVTQEQWEKVMGISSNPSSTRGAKLPVTDISWNNCQDFIKKLNAKTNGGYRLPTEAEWEYACRAGTKTAYSFGDSLKKSEANYGDGAAVSIKSSGSYKPNGFGLYDMHGNVWEWCEDWKANYPAKAVKDPKGPMTGEYRVLRGGSFYNSVSTARSSFRNDVATSASRDGVFGFRLARTP